MSVFPAVEPFDPERYIGMVSHVDSSCVKISLDDGQTLILGEDGSSHSVNIGDFVVIECGDYGVLGKFTDLHAERIPGGMNGSNPVPNMPSTIATLQLLSSIDPRAGKVSPGIVQSPKIGNRVYIAESQLIQMVLASKKKQQSEQGLSLAFARLAHSGGTALSFTPEMLFGRHAAIVGTTGGGKSWSVARLVEETARYRSKVILFDPSGEFNRMERGTRHLYMGLDPEPLEHWQETVLPYYQLTESDLFAIFKPGGQSQGPKLRAAIQSLKLARLSPGIATDGVIIKAHKFKQHFEAELQKFARQIELPEARFDITKLTRQLENECVNPYRSPLEPHVWGETNRADYAACIPLMSRISDIIDSPNLASIFRPNGKPSLLQEINSFLVDDELRVLRISMQYLPFIHNAREITANAIGRYLLRLARESRFRSMPVLVVVDEAHQFVNKAVEDPSNNLMLDSFAIIAKEGRKYCLNIILATQRPRDIPEGVLSQMGTLVVHRLINDQDRSVIERACGEMDSASVKAVPMLTPGEAVIVGVDFPMPITVKVEKPVYEPDSKGPDFQRHWR